MIGEVLTYQIVSGLWSPRDQKYSWVVAAEFDTLKDAQNAIDEAVYPGDIYSLATASEARSQANANRAAYTGSPIAIVVVKTRLVERFGRKGPPDWALNDSETMERVAQ